jgi:hypothetical protein
MQKAQTSGNSDIPSTQFYAAGYPPAAVAPSPGLNGAALTSYAGQIDFTNPASGNAYLAALFCGQTLASLTGYFILYDRLWHNSGISITTTTEQAITSPTWPARDRVGSTNGDGVFVAIEVSTGVGAGAIANTTLNYTNSAGTAGRTGVLPPTPSAPNPRAGNFLMFSLQAGDAGVRSVEGLTLGTSWVSGTIHLVAVRPIALVPAPSAVDSFNFDAISLGFPRLYDNSVLFSAAYNPNLSASPLQATTLQYAHG